MSKLDLYLYMLGFVLLFLWLIAWLLGWRHRWWNGDMSSCARCEGQKMYMYLVSVPYAASGVPPSAVAHTPRHWTCRGYAILPARRSQSRPMRPWHRCRARAMHTRAITY